MSRSLLVSFISTPDRGGRHVLGVGSGAVPRCLYSDPPLNSTVKKYNINMFTAQSFTLIKMENIFGEFEKKPIMNTHSLSLVLISKALVIII